MIVVPDRASPASCPGRGEEKPAEPAGEEGAGQPPWLRWLYTGNRATHGLEDSHTACARLGDTDLAGPGLLSLIPRDSECIQTFGGAAERRVRRQGAGHELSVQL